MNLSDLYCEAQRKKKEQLQHENLEKGQRSVSESYIPGDKWKHQDLSLLPSPYQGEILTYYYLPFCSRVQRRLIINTNSLLWKKISFLPGSIVFFIMAFLKKFCTRWRKEGKMRVGSHYRRHRCKLVWKTGFLNSGQL